MNRRELLEQGRSLGWALGYVEKDYLQHILLRALARRSGPSLVFKGGTALQKVWGLPRFSEDLDFTYVGTDEPVGVVEPALRDFRNYGHETVMAKVVSGSSSWSCRVSIAGPLFQDTEKSRCFIRVEFSRREKVARTPAAREIMPPYSNLPSYLVTTMVREEILAEKVRALFAREKARDLYDLVFLLNRGTRPSRELIDRKLALYDLAFEPRAFRERVALVAEHWQRELGPLLPRPAEVEQALNTIHAGFAELGEP